ncbi:MAG: hypothetical protein ACKPKO_65770, partial [Candidatus Fonsibacter sp.]
YNTICEFIWVSFFVALTYIMSYIRYVWFCYRGERLLLRVSSFNDRTVVGRVWKHPVNPGLLLGQLIQVPLGDVLDECCVFK